MIHCVHYWSVWSHNLLLAWQIVLLPEIWPGHGPNIRWHLHSLPGGRGEGGVYPPQTSNTSSQAQTSPDLTVRKYQNKNLSSSGLCIESNHWHWLLSPLTSLLLINQANQHVRLIARIGPAFLLFTSLRAVDKKILLKIIGRRLLMNL